MWKKIPMKPKVYLECSCYFLIKEVSCSFSYQKLHSLTKNNILLWIWRKFYYSFNKFPLWFFKRNVEVWSEISLSKAKS